MNSAVPRMTRTCKLTIFTKMYHILADSSCRSPVDVGARAVDVGLGPVGAGICSVVVRTNCKWSQNAPFALSSQRHRTLRGSDESIPHLPQRHGIKHRKRSFSYGLAAQYSAKVKLLSPISSLQSERPSQNCDFCFVLKSQTKVFPVAFGALRRWTTVNHGTFISVP